MLYRSVVKTTKEMPNLANLSGFEIARKVTALFCEEDPHIIKKSGKYLDHYNKDRNTIKLSPDVFDGENIYAAVTAINIALETKEENQQIPVGRKLNDFLVLVSYIIIIVGSFFANPIVIRLGMFIYILAFVFEGLLLSFLFPKDEFKQLLETIKKAELIKPSQEYENNCLLLALSRIATLPYSFINHFR